MIEQVEAQIDKTSPIPLYEQLRQALLDAITSGKIPVGAKLPTEEELCTRFSVSRPVARQAYSALISEGYVERRRGRGTFVRMPDILGRFLQTQLSFTEEMEITGHSHRTGSIRLRKFLRACAWKKMTAAIVCCVCATWKAGLMCW